MSDNKDLPESHEPSLDELLAKMNNPSSAVNYAVTYCGMVAIVGRPNKI